MTQWVDAKEWLVILESFNKTILDSVLDKGSKMNISLSLTPKQHMLVVILVMYITMVGMSVLRQLLHEIKKDNIKLRELTCRIRLAE